MSKLITPSRRFPQEADPIEGPRPRNNVGILKLGCVWCRWLRIEVSEQALTVEVTHEKMVTQPVEVRGITHYHLAAKHVPAK